MEKQENLFLLFRANWSDRKIQRITGIHRKTISRYRKKWEERERISAKKNEPLWTSDLSREVAGKEAQSVPPPENKCPPAGVVHFEVPTDPQSGLSHGGDEPDLLAAQSSRSQASAHHELINEKLKKGQSARSIYQDLVIERDYAGSYDSIKRYVRKLRSKTPTLYARIETPAGEEAQVDFGKGAPVLVDGRYRTPHLFVMTLSNSRKSYEEAVWSQNVETFIQCHVNAFRFFGGVPRIVRIDNLKSAVLKAHLYEPTINPNYAAFAGHYGFVPIPCRVRTPQHKGKVESGVKYVQNNALKGKRFDSLEEENRYLRWWNRTWASTRIHGTRKQQVQKMFLAEKEHLMPLPEKPFEYFKIGVRKVNALDSHIEVAGAFYPVPPKYMGQKVVVHYNSKWVKVYHQDKLIQHLSQVPRGRFHPDKSCLPPQKNWGQQRYLRYLLDQCRVMGSSVLQWAEGAVARRSYSAYRSIQGVVALGRKYPPRVVNQACGQAFENNGFSYHIVKELSESIRIQKEIQHEIGFIQQDELIRCPKEYQKLLNGED